MFLLTTLPFVLAAIVGSNAGASFRSHRPHHRHFPVQRIQAPNSSHMITPREAHGLVGLPDGTLFAIGGTDLETFEVLNSTEIYDFVTKTW